MIYYSYFKDTSSDGSIAYLFSTEDNIIYTISFDAIMYTTYLDHFPNLLQNGFGIGISAELKPSKKDFKVSKTIIEIIFDFISNENKDSIILYHCDYIDGEQRLRNRIFEGWHNIANVENRIFRYSLKVDIPDANIIHYIGFLCINNNKFKEDAINEFAEFSVDLVSSSSQK